MDPYSAEGELVNLHTAFHTAQYSSVISFDTSDLSPSNHLPARILQLRSKLALKQHDDVLSELKSEGSDEVDLQAVKAFAKYEKNGDASETEALVAENGDNAMVQVLGGIVLAREGREKEALTLLGRHEGSLDAIALIVQIHLQMNRLDLAQAEVKKARNWAQDHLLVNLAEAWVGLREGGPQYQPSFYVFEELATAPPSLPSTTSSSSSSSDSSTAQNTTVLLSQAIAELHLGRLPEAEAALSQALQQEPENADVLANAVVLYTIQGKRSEARGLRERLEGVAPEHELVKGLREKQESFQGAMGRYKPAFEVGG